MRCPPSHRTLHRPIGDNNLIPAGAAKDRAAAPGGVKLKVFACRNCGYVRLHSANLLSDISRRA